ncbi:23S rRNA (uracil(1939)-C(5))-methyltransferase RlmD [Thalassomonas sp. M1454]|uniref:23S rRNA (uracil(1939)-C(5))-methyltransferase RlmD n=1 Tax=Thalassomonas sp. M1454 TaxID=2594477 RepID=UPI00117F8DB2|nr:23S rRNA (uracil(1939)-C(5))-methyltransferase RlmD [Thalassomonas sp. M1454]TRX55828.1 23S rRNA (uracil(1939)-C(5))-methyltransferase RlmD [Thalassomonas sp. M1454]
MVNFYKPSAKKNNLNQTFTIDIERLDINGDGVARLNKKPVFVSGALPGEQATVKVIEEKSKYLRAKVIKLTNLSSQRAQPECKHFYQCGGCDLQHMQTQAQLSYKQNKVAELLRRNAELIDLPWCEPLTSPSLGYRRKARIGVQYNKHAQAIVGFRQKNSNTLTAIKSCPILTSTFSQEFSEFTAVINALSAKKAISHIEVIAADQPRVIFRHIRDLAKADVQLLTDFTQDKDYQLVLQNEDSIVDLNKQATQALTYQAAGCKFSFSETDFVQVNANLNQLMIEQACQWLELSAEDNVLDLFCGLGNFSLPIALQVNSVIGVEGVDAMVERATTNSGINALTNTKFYQADLNAEQSDWPWFNENINKVLLDPARAGALNAVKNIVELNIKTILYISCDPATMARDAKVLIDNGYRLEKLGLMDMFAQTRHVETMALFTRK